VAVFSPAANRPLQGGKSGSPGFRFVIYSLISMALMFLDQRQHYLEQARYVLQGVAFPVHMAVNSPATAVSWLQENMKAREVLEAENKQLHAHQRELELELMRLDALAKENGELRGLKEALPPVVERWLPAEIVTSLDSLRPRVLINRGANNGVFKGQTLLDDAGVVGQTTHVGPWSAEVILITDPEHAIPVVIARTQVPTIAGGAGDQATLVLPYLPANADIKEGDKLVTSGLGGVFPAGYPVAKVTEVHRDAADPHARIVAVPYARIAASGGTGSLDDREVVLVWFRGGHPAAPVDASEGRDLKSGNPAMQPQQTQGAEGPAVGIGVQPEAPSSVPPPESESSTSASSAAASPAAGASAATSSKPGAAPAGRPATPAARASSSSKSTQKPGRHP
jgi:rod shape-determining protein MreC